MQGNISATDGYDENDFDDRRDEEKDSTEAEIKKVEASKNSSPGENSSSKDEEPTSGSEKQ